MTPARTTLSNAVPLRSPLRWLAAVGLVAAAVSHMPPVQEHLEEAPWVGVSFIVLGVVFSMLAAVLLMRDTRLAWLGSGVLCLAAVVGYVLSRTVGLPQIGDDVGNWTGEAMGVLAITSEGLTIVLALFALLHRPQRRLRIVQQVDAAA
ncbi:MAG TPA: hypothetical protein VFT62_09285 [Mycobacteriales bacterium]|nr:hypothetical protein [Mycobacteriales bacterium]